MAALHGSYERECISDARGSHWTTGYIALPILELRKRRVLPVLDNLEVQLEEGKVLEGLRSGLLACGQLLRRLDHLTQQSHLLLTSWEKPPPGSDG